MSQNKLYLAILLFLGAITISYGQKDDGRGFKKSTPITIGKRVALLIGNSNYTGQAHLGDNPKNDAEDLGQVLEDIGFDVTVKLDLTKPKMERSIRDFHDDSKYAEVALFYYAGHGMQSLQKNYLIPLKADIQKEEHIHWESIDMFDDIQSKMENKNEEKLNILILDACRNNPFRSWLTSNDRSWTDQDKQAGLRSYPKPPTGTIIAFSTSPGSVASNGEGDNGLYTAELIRQIKKPQRITDVFMNVRNEVFKKSNKLQRPWEDSSLTAPFYLVKSDKIYNSNLLITTPVDFAIQINYDESYSVKASQKLNTIPLNIGYNHLTYKDPDTDAVLYEEELNLIQGGNMKYDIPIELYPKLNKLEIDKKQFERTINQGESITLQAEGISSRGKLSYEWIGENNYTKSLTAAPTNKDNYKLKITSTLGDHQITDYIIYEILVNKVKARIIGPDSTMRKSYITLDATTSEGSGQLSYKWSDGKTTPSIKIKVSRAKTYTVTVTSTYNSTQTSDTAQYSFQLYKSKTEKPEDDPTIEVNQSKNQKIVIGVAFNQFIGVEEQGEFHVPSCSLRPGYYLNNKLGLYGNLGYDMEGSADFRGLIMGFGLLYRHVDLELGFGYINKKTTFLYFDTGGAVNLSGRQEGLQGELAYYIADLKIFGLLSFYPEKSLFARKVSLGIGGGYRI